MKKNVILLELFCFDNFMLKLNSEKQSFSWQWILNLLSAEANFKECH